MLSITFKLMRRSARMLIPAGIAILIGAAFVASTFLFGNALNASLTKQMTAQYGGATHIATASKDAPGYDENATYLTTVDDFHPDELAAIDGVKGIRPDVYAQLQATSGDRHTSIEAITASGDPALMPITLTEGEWPTRDGQIALPAAVADQLGLKVGGTVRIDNGQTASYTGADPTVLNMTISGMTSDPAGAYPYYGGAAAITEADMGAFKAVEQAVAQDPASSTAPADSSDTARPDPATSAKAFGASTVMAVYLDIDPVKADAALPRINQLMPKGYLVMSRADSATRMMESMGTSQGTNMITIFMLCFGGIAMFVAALVIANTFQVLVAQRRRTLALLRTIGARKGQLYGSVVLEACLLGLIASAAGVACAFALMGALDAGGASFNGLTLELVPSWQAVAVPVAFALLITVLASLSSARTATAVTPLEALRPLELAESSRRPVKRIVFGTLLIIAGLAAAGFAIWQTRLGAAGQEDSLYAKQFSVVLIAAMAGAAAVFLGVVVTAVAWSPRLTGAVGALAAHAGPAARIADANVAKNPRRVAATGTALLIGVTLVTTIAVGADSAKQTSANALASRFSVDLIASGPNLSQTSVNKVAKVDGIESTAYAPIADATLGGGPDDPGVLLIGMADEDVRAQVHADLGDAHVTGGTVLLPAFNATDGKETPVKNGDKTTLGIIKMTGEGTTGEQTGTLAPLTLTAAKADYRRISINHSYVAFVPPELFENGTIAATGHIMLATVNPNATLGTVLSGVRDAVAADAGTNVTGPVAEREQWESNVNVAMALMVALLAVAIVIALIGVANTLSLSVIERTRESATLRAIGMTRGQLRHSLAVEALLIALVASLAGIVLGTLFGWLGSYVVFIQFGAVTLPLSWGVDAVVIAVAAVSALLASVLPARRAVSVPPVVALAEA